MKTFFNLRENLSGGLDAEIDLDIDGVIQRVPYTLEPEEVADIPAGTPIIPVDSAELSLFQKQQAKRQLANQLDEDLAALVHTFPDGKSIQVREQDFARLNVAIEGGESIEWLMADNKKRLTTVAELQEALVSGIAQNKSLWTAYVNAVDAL